jgi:hypothetical protein
MDFVIISLYIKFGSLLNSLEKGFVFVLRYVCSGQ